MAISDGTVLRIVASLLMPDNVIAQNVFYAVFADTGVSNDADDAVSDLVDWVEEMYTQLLAGLTDVVAPTEIMVYEYDALDEDWDEVGGAPWTVTFTNVDDMLPHGVAFIVHAKSTNPDVQATKYLGGFADDAVIESDVNAANLARLADFNDSWVTAFVGALTGGDFGPGVWSPTKSNFFLFNGITTVNGLAGYQRRRKPGVGI